MGTSVKVAKYINAPTIEAKKLAPRELPPTAFFIISEGIIPLYPGRLLEEKGEFLLKSKY